MPEAEFNLVYIKARGGGYANDFVGHVIDRTKGIDPLRGKKTDYIIADEKSKGNISD